MTPVAAAAHRPATALATLHWPEYAMEGGLLGLFMISACCVTTLLQHPASPLVRALPDPLLRRVLIGCTMGITAIGLIYSPWGKRSGAHMNPAVTLTFACLHKVAPHDAIAYVLAQFTGGALGVAFAAIVLGPRLAHPKVYWAVTLPGPAGRAAAFAAE